MRKRRMLKLILIAFIVYSVVAFLFVGVNFYLVFHRFETPAYSRFLEYDDVSDAYKREEVQIISGKNKLQGYLYGRDNTKGIILLCHGVFSGARSYMGEALYFADNGYQVLAFDYTGYCNSEGKGARGLYQAVRDLDAAITFAEQDSRFCDGPLFLYGHSWGGYAVTTILSYDHDIKGVVSVSGFNEPQEIILEWAEKEIGSAACLVKPYVSIVQRLWVGRDCNVKAVDAINGCDTPIMIVHGVADDVVSYTKAGIIAHKDEITNPNVVYLIRDGEKQNDHTNLYRTRDAASYISELDEQYEALRKKHGRKLSAEVEQAFYDGIDKERSSALDEEFLDAVLAFFEECAVSK